MEASRFAKELDGYGSFESDDQQFSDIIYLALTRWGITESKMKEAFNLTSQMVNHWSTGQSLPLPAARRIIVNWIRKELARNIKVL